MKSQIKALIPSGIRPAFDRLNSFRGNLWYANEWVISSARTLGRTLPSREKTLEGVSARARLTGRLKTAWLNAPCAYVGNAESWELLLKHSLLSDQRFQFIEGRSLVAAGAASEAVFREVLGDVQVVFIYAFRGWTEVMPRLHQHCVVFVITWDDSFAFYNSPYPKLAPVIDCMLSQTPECARKYLSMGMSWLFFAEGGLGHALPDRDKLDRRVVYVGNQNGKRATTIKTLSELLGATFSAYGPGSKHGTIAPNQAMKVQREAAAAIALSDLAFGVGLTHLKCRHFEIPCAGGLLLAQETPLLRQYYAIGQECLTYKTTGDCEEAARWILSNPDAAWEIRKAGHARATAQHTWLARFRTLLEELEACD